MKSISYLFSSAILVLVLLFGMLQEPVKLVQKPAKHEQQDVATYTPDKAHSKISFKVRHLGITNVNGAFDEYEASVTFDGDDLSTLQADATIQIASVNTGIERRDNHLRSDDFFNAEMYPTMKFASTGVRSLEGNKFELVGDLTIRDVTKEVVFDVEFLGMSKMGPANKAGFVAEATVNRFDYNLKWDRLTEAGRLVVAENIKITLDLELNEASEDAG